MSSADAVEHDEHRFALVGDRLVDVDDLKGRPDLVDEVRRASQRGELLCPVCREGLVGKLGEVMKWHFAHRADAEYKWHEPESDMHKLGKRRLLEWAQAQWPDGEAREEWRLPDISQIADVLAVPPGRRPVALEIQYADLAAGSWRARHDGYRRMGLDDCWLLGHTRLRVKGRMAMIDSLASAIVGARQPLLYLQPRSKLVTWVRVPPAAVFRAGQGERLGKLPVQVTKAPLARLRFDGATPYFAAEDDPQ